MQARKISAGRRAQVTRALSSGLPPETLITGETGLRPYDTPGCAESVPPLAVVLARTTAQVQATVRLCRSVGVPIIPRGAGTNLTHGTASVGESVMICVGGMRRILGFDPVGGLIRVEAGVRNLAVSDHVRGEGWFHGPNPSSRRTCTIGGNVATNSGGSTAFRYGVTVNSLAGGALVLPDGTLLEFGGAGFEDSGADIAGILCGSEGQLGILTEALLRLHPRPEASRSLMVPFKSIDYALEAATFILREGIVPAQLDLLDASAVGLCEAYHPSGYPINAASILLIELAGPHETLDQDAAFISRLDGIAGDSVHADTREEATDLWAGRERIYGAVARAGGYLALDCAVPLSRIGEMVNQVARLCAALGVRQVTTLHVADGTVHAFLLHERGNLGATAAAHACADTLRQAAIDLGGTFTAEYGVGLLARDLMPAQFTSQDLAVQQRVVVNFGGEAMNLAKVLPSSLVGRP